MSIAVHTYGLLHAAPGNPEVQGFVDGVQTVFALAERSDGFIWRFNRLLSEEAQAEYESYASDPAVVITLSVWETVEKLKHYVFSTLHGKFYERKSEWFTVPNAPMMTLWNVDPKDRPTVAEAKERLQHLRTHGPTLHAFDWNTAGEFADASR